MLAWTNLVNTAVDFYGDLEKISGTRMTAGKQTLQSSFRW
jgi:hypothetical protein